jgi:short-subunit dehydrogenase
VSVFQDRHAVVTGASSGIGRALALALAAEGAVLHLLGRDEKRLAAVREEVEARGGKARTYVLDLLNDAAVSAFSRELEGVTDGLNLLIHSAGTVTLGPIAEAPVEELDAHYRLNVRAPYLLTQKLLPLLRRAEGQVVFINSGSGLSARADWGQYAASKHALKALADSLREEEKAHGVRVISIYPGRTATSMQAHVHRLEGREYVPENFLRPEDVARQTLSVLELPRGAIISDLVIRRA